MIKKYNLFTVMALFMLTILHLYSEDVSASESSQTMNETRAKFSTESTAVSFTTLEQAIQKALEASPRLRSATAWLDGAKGYALQAGVLPNPTIEIEAENIAGTGNFSGIDSANITYSISQRLEIGGERGYRKKAAKQTVMQGQYDLTIVRLNLIRDVRVAYADAVSAQDMLTLARERKDLEQAMIETVRKRVNSASAPEIQLRKAEIGLSTAHVFVERLERELKHTKHVLASLWEGHDEPITLDNSEFTTLTIPPSEDMVEAMLSQTADLKRWEAEKDRAKAIFKLEQAEAIPNPIFSFSVRDIRESNDQALVVGVALPIPVFDRNRGNIDHARSMINKAKSDQVDSHINLRNKVFEWLENEVNAYHHAQTLKMDIIPAAEEAFELARDGYQTGRFPYLEVLDAQRTLFEVKEQYIVALNQYHKASAFVERLTTTVGDMNNE
ncbi:MAG: cobalt-zinc-cadmium efflux system outer membrane protein [Candidatus Omnitrophota bacterium]|jgi:cobalt-zinc-cadmium efflux system outer membrane protein